MQKISLERLALLCACAILVACAGGGDGAPSNLSTGCASGTTVSCLCPGGGSGTQVCDPTGTVFTSCSCPGTSPVAPGVGQMASGQTGLPAAGSGAPEGPMMGTPVVPEPMMGEPVMPAPGTEMPTSQEPMAEAPMTQEPMTPMTPAGDEGVPEGDHCAPAADWDPMWAQFEEEVLLYTNEARATGFNCDTQGEFGPADPLTMNAQLRCSARLHSMDMGEAGYFDHTNLAGESPFVRMMQAGYSGGTMGENIAKGQQSPREVVDGWLESDGHCANIMNPRYTDIGVGYWQGAATNQFFNGNKLWTQNFGRPAGGGGNCPFPGFC